MITHADSLPDQATVLLVDDEPNILKALTRLFFDDGYKILIADCGEAALEILKQEHVDAIISDLRMPGMTGSEFFQLAAEISPDVPRILLSGQRDMDLAIQAVNDGKISQYLEKPWDASELRTVITQILEQRFADLKSRHLSNTLTTQNVILSDLNKELDKQRAVAESESLLKSRFLAMMSHEIRTPITGILGVLEALKDTRLADEQLSLLDTGINSSLHLKRIVDDLLDMSKLEAGQMSIQSVVYEPNELVASAVELFRPKFNTKGLSIDIDTNHPLPRLLKGDPARVKQILLNLISNAWKFTESGGVVIRTNCGEDEFSICVEDSGIGVPESARAQLFLEFSMLDDSETRRQEGTGLGLAICRRLASLMKGRVDYTENPAGGSRFTLNLPWIEPETGEEPVTVTEETTVHPGIRVLLADDNATNLKVIGLLLRNLGCLVSEAVNGEQAVELATRQSAGEFDLVLMDIAMPVMDGIQATRQIRNAFSPEQLPVIAMTAHVMDNERELFQQAGMNGVLLKPLRKTDLSRILAQHAITIPVTATVTQDSSLLDEAVLAQLVADTGASVFPKLADSFVQDCHNRLAIITSHHQANDLENLIREAHTLGSSAGMFGATQLQLFCRELEAQWKAGSRVIAQADRESLIECINNSIAAFNEWSARFRESS